MRVAIEDAFALEREQLVGDRGGAVEVYGLADLPHRRRVSLSVDRLRDVADDGRLAARQLSFGSAGALRSAPAGGRGVLHPGHLRARSLLNMTLSRPPPLLEH